MSEQKALWLRSKGVGPSWKRIDPAPVFGAGRMCGKPSAKPGLCNSYQLECYLSPKNPHPRSLCCYSQKLHTLLAAGLADICSEGVCVFTQS